MKILSAPQQQQWDAYTLAEQGIRSIELMERSAYVCFRWLIDNNFTKQPVHLFCGKGNNGGDGLALARMLLENNVPVTVHILETGKAGTADFQENLQKLHLINANIFFIQTEDFFPGIKKDDLVIDALFGSGLNKPLTGTAESLVQYINQSGATIISIDIPGGMFADKSSRGFITVHATHTLCFQQMKPAFLFPENEMRTGQVHILPIGLSSQFENTVSPPYELVEKDIIRLLLQPRRSFAHKGNFGHAALVAGSFGMLGAVVLAARACLRTGTGKLTCHIPTVGHGIVQAAVPEAMCQSAGEQFISTPYGFDLYDSIGIGPGLGTHTETIQWLQSLLHAVQKPLVLDADALNIIAGSAGMINELPAGSVITPHPKEFERLFGAAANDFERLEMAIKQASALNIYIVLKGHYTAIITPRNKVYFNSTGNAGMAKAGMGDVLTGIITGLMTQHYPLPEAAILGTYLHGLAGDLAAEKYSQQAMQAGDLLDCMGEAWNLLLG